jgi:spermidine/putrescine transport system permease protein
MTNNVPTPAARSLSRRGFRWLSSHTVAIAAGLALVYLFIPIAYTFAFSFNNYKKTNITWIADGSPTLRSWRNPCGIPEVCPAVANSLKIGILATVIATVIGTMMAFALVRHRFRGRAATNLLIFLPMATPEVVLGASLLTLFVQTGSRIGLELGFWTIVIAHVMFCISFVVVTVKARLAGLDPRLEQAAMDLYANETQTFLRVTLPLVMPGVISAALLSFSLSFDDFIITYFNSGSVSTFPKFVYVSYFRGIPAQANVIGTAMFVLALFLVLISQGIGRRRALR